MASFIRSALPMLPRFACAELGCMAVSICRRRFASSTSSVKSFEMKNAGSRKSAFGSLSVFADWSVEPLLFDAPFFLRRLSALESLALDFCKGGAAVLDVVAEPFFSLVCFGDVLFESSFPSSDSCAAFMSSSSPCVSSSVAVAGVPTTSSPFISIAFALPATTKDVPLLRAIFICRLMLFMAAKAKPASFFLAEFVVLPLST
mmetsp:Transcript_24840/g.69743  ORF Transcript_24840/g.69743 Transcript_24840/m.69743 type:complete len:203 (-) Transcript_24840:220-828(-)